MQLRQKQLCLTPTQFERLRLFKNVVIKSFESTDNMAVQLNNPNLSSYFEMLCAYVGRGLGRVKFMKAGLPIDTAETLTTEQLEIQPPEEELDLTQQTISSFKLCQRFIQKIMPKGHQLIPASCNSLRRPADYLYIVIIGQ